ncbi:SigE family RNA polymerase sigma factor [Nocardioides sp.]|uniref:SigE family RNA polymerase sigma factor n=1 Tax=Nocardioides sp. TaxID=35761 RepID=UPI00271E28D6|nr:SigE family RNA polymerase sigma factor [Nocardioides sp.]MDO9458112.1 SigE family RNA polymerase sigma factor [Nocardioides sp.]
MRTQDRDAEFSAYVAAHRVRMVRAALLLTGGAYAEAEDLVQTVLVRLYLRWGRVSRVEDPVGYGMRALTNVFLDERRRAHRRREVVSDHDADGPRPGDQMAEHDVRATVFAALAALPPRQRAVVVLRHFLDHDVAGTADALGITEGTVKSQNAKALTRLRELLGTDIDYEEVGP